MKKALIILSAFLIMQPVMAKNVKVEALSNFSTANPPKTWKLKVIEGFVLSKADFILNSLEHYEKKSEHSHVEYCCEFCKMKFRKNAKYVRHLRTHTKEVFFDFGNYATRNRLLATFLIVGNHLAEKTIWFVI